MTKFRHACRQPDLTPQELHQMIHADETLHRNVMDISQAITPAATTLTRAIIVLGPNTIKNMALNTLPVD
ncbi:MAG: HDOD domain-containing protein [Desulfobulbaceae bacterium]|nr:HDOD domain-containing protein [Desulfobulbaceae bacterium]